MIDRLRQLQGLLNTPANNPNSGLLGNISQGALLGASLYGQGIQGKDPLASFFPALTQTAQLSKLLQPEEKEGERLARLLSEEEVKKKFPNLPAGTIVQEKPNGEFTFKEPPAGIVKERAKLKSTVGLINEIEKGYNDLNKPVGGVFGVGFDPDRLSGQIGKFTGSEKGKKYAKFLANIDKTTTFLTQAISGAAVSEAEAERIKRLIPQVTDTEAVFEAKLESLRRYLNDARKNYGDDIKGAIENLDISQYEPKSKNNFQFKIGDDGIYDVTGG